MSIGSGMRSLRIDADSLNLINDDGKRSARYDETSEMLYTPMIISQAAINIGRNEFI